jgi:antitoxin (DNA-binding transcriptional repressor) of toxin-antitoxin stability system
MRAVGLKTLKNRLSEYVRLAANGETVLVTDHDRIVAELAPPRAGRSEALADAMLAEAVRRGWATVRPGQRFDCCGSTPTPASSANRLSTK